MAKKFIINDNRIIMSSAVGFHIELSQKCDNPKLTVGGGWWELVDDKLYLYGASTEYGMCKKEDIVASFSKLGASLKTLEIWHSCDFKFIDCLKNAVKIKDKELLIIHHPSDEPRRN